MREPRHSQVGVVLGRGIVKPVEIATNRPGTLFRPRPVAAGDARGPISVSVLCPSTPGMGIYHALVDTVANEKSETNPEALNSAEILPQNDQNRSAGRNTGVGGSTLSVTEGQDNCDSFQPQNTGSAKFSVIPARFRDTQHRSRLSANNFTTLRSPAPFNATAALPFSGISHSILQPVDQLDTRDLLQMQRTVFLNHQTREQRQQLVETERQGTIARLQSKPWRPRSVI